MRSLSLPVSAHLSAGLLRGFPRWALILMKMVSIPWSMHFQRSCMMSVMMFAPGLPHIERNFLCPDHFCMDERRQAKSERRTIGLSSPLIFASCSTRHAKFPSSSLPNWQHPPLSSSIFIESAESRPHYTLVIGSISGVYSCKED